MINKYIDHTILRNDASIGDINRYCNEAIINNFASVCSYSYYAKNIVDNLKDTNVNTCVVIGFPSGACTTNTKVAEALECVSLGVDEFDMVINVSALKNKDIEFVKKDIFEVRKATKNKILKVIIETCLLNSDEKKLMCELCMQTNVDFIKTSTGFGKEGARVEDIILFKSILGDKVKIKASGGIRTHSFAKELIDAGANRIGASNGILLLKD